MRLRSIFFASLPLALSLFALNAHADTTFDWSVTGPAASNGGFVDTGSGTLTATDTSGQWVVESISGTFAGSTVTGPISFYNADNLLFPDSTFIDTDGIAFQTASGVEADIWSFYTPGSTVTPGNNYGEELGGTTPGFGGVGTFTLAAAAPTPEPSSLVLLGSGLLGMVGAARRRIFRS